MFVKSKDDTDIKLEKGKISKEVRERWQNLNTRMGLESLLDQGEHRAIAKNEFSFGNEFSTKDNFFNIHKVNYTKENAPKFG